MRRPSDPGNSFEAAVKISQLPIFRRSKLLCPTVSAWPRVSELTIDTLLKWHPQIAVDAPHYH